MGINPYGQGADRTHYEKVKEKREAREAIEARNQQAPIPMPAPKQPRSKADRSR